MVQSDSMVCAFLEISGFAPWPPKKADYLNFSDERPEKAQVSRRSSPQRLEHGIKRAATLQALAVGLKQYPRELPNGHLGREQPRDRRP